MPSPKDRKVAVGMGFRIKTEFLREADVYNIKPRLYREIFKPSIIRTDKREEEVRKEGKMKGHDRWWKKPKGPDLRLEDISPFMHRWVCRFMIQSSAGAGSPGRYKK